MNVKKIIAIAGIVIGLVLFYQLGGDKYFSVVFFRNLYAGHPWLTAGIFFLIYVVFCSLPIAAALTIIAGMIFGLGMGVLLVSFASTIGATLVFLMARWLLRDWVQERFGRYLETVNRGMERDGAFYLLSLRLIPAVPFFAINPVMGLMPIRALTFYLVSQLGMLPATVVYVYAGVQLGAVEEFSTAGILKPGIVAALVLLATFPFIARGMVEFLKRKKVYRNFKKPRRFDNNLLVIGAGSAGLVSAYIAAAVKARVTLIEKDRMGGDCLNTGCVPSKALIRAAKAVREIEAAGELGIEVPAPRVDFARVMERVQAVIERVEPHDSVERYTELGVNCVQGDARLLSPWEVEVNGQRISSRNIVIATGARPLVPPVPGIDELQYLTSENLWQLRELPARLLIMGGGPIGCELAQAFKRLGSRVTLVDMMPRILPREDEDVSAFVQKRFEQEGIRVLVNHKSVAFQKIDGDNVAVLEHGDETRREVFDQLLVAVGRRANTEGLNLAALGIETNPNGTLPVDDFLRTRFPNITACGDVIGPYQFTHVAAHQAWYAAVNGLFGGLRKFRVDYRVIPWVTFTDPEVARVGLSEQDARERNISCEITKYDLAELDRAIADNVATGFVKVLTPPGKDKILGATIVGHRAGDLLTEFVTGMKRNLGLNAILGTIHSYPTLSEANKYAAGEWKRAHVPEKLLGWVTRYHRWRLGR